MTAFMYAKAIESITAYGFIDPVTVMELGAGAYLIIDGEHRWRAAGDLGIDEIPCFVLPPMAEPAARKLTIVLNELHGQASPEDVGELLRDILAGTSMEDLLVALPYTEDILSGFLGIGSVQLPSGPAGPSVTSTPSGTTEKWVERTYRLPKTAALVIDEALEKAKDGDEVESWQALERIAADFLAG